MNTLQASLWLLAAACASGSIAAEPTLKSQVAAADGWVGYRVAAVAGAGQSCCYTIARGGARTAGCRLDGGTAHGSTILTSAQPSADATLAVYLHVKGGVVDTVRAWSASCPIEDAAAVRWIDPVVPAESVALLAQTTDGDGKAGEQALVAIAQHADASATAALERNAEPGRPRERREQALFWLGQMRGAAGLAAILRHARSDPDADLREHAVFAASQSSAEGAYAAVRTIARDDAADAVRSRALFWMAQMDAPAAADDILAALSREASESVREQAVFALSQLDDGRGEEALIAVLRGDQPREVKQRALFWLGQSGSPRALAFFDDVLR